MITVFFRYDDYSSLSHAAVDRGLIGIFRRHGVACTFAVVPAITSIYPRVEGTQQEELPLPADKAADLRAAVADGTVDMALHGWRHLANAFTGHPEPSEFKGLAVAEQKAILQRGSDFLAAAIGVRPAVFVPPWNSYDGNTIAALDATGFRGVSANRYSPAPPASTALRFAPITTEIAGLREAVERAESGAQADPVIGVMMHPYDFQESGDARAVISLAGFEQLLGWLRQQQSIRIVPISALVDSGSMDRRRLLANSPSVLERAYPRFLRKAGADPVYHSATRARLRNLLTDALFAGVMLLPVAAGVLAGWFAAWVLSRVHAPLTVLVPIVTAIAAALLLVRALRERALYARGATLLALMAGVLLSAAL